MTGIARVALNTLIVLALVTLYTTLAAYFGLSVTVLPTWFEGLTLYMIPALLGMQSIPIIGTFIEILIVWATFEFAYFTIRTILRILEWANLTGKPIID